MCFSCQNVILATLYVINYLELVPQFYKISVSPVKISDWKFFLSYILRVPGIFTSYIPNLYQLSTTHSQTLYKSCVITFSPSIVIHYYINSLIHKTVIVTDTRTCNSPDNLKKKVKTFLTNIQTPIKMSKLSIWRVRW